MYQRILSPRNLSEINKLELFYSYFESYQLN